MKLSISNSLPVPESDTERIYRRGNFAKILNIRHLFLIILILTLAISCQHELPGETENVVPKHARALAELDGYFTFLIASDLGRNGYYDQKPVAEMMGAVVSIVDAEFVAAVGDIHHFLGVQSVQDPLWQTNYEWIYKHPELMMHWYPVLGNHEYEGNTQAVLDYTAISRRWEMTARYYDMKWQISDNVEVLLLFIDTVPLIDKYRNKPEEYPDAGKQSMERQLVWIDSTLSASGAKWKIVLGHHPIYAGTYKADIERTDLQKRLQPLLDKHHVDFVVSGHIHNFQHIRVTGSGIDYLINTSASQAREVDERHRMEGQLFTSSDSGFSLCSVKEDELIITLVNKRGAIIYQYARKK